MGGVLHCFTEDLDMAREAVGQGFHISLSGIVTFRNASSVRELARRLPLDRLLIETDSPYLAPVPHRGKPNEPAWVVEVAECIAAERGISVEEVAMQTTANFYRLFKAASPEARAKCVSHWPSRPGLASFIGLAGKPARWRLACPLLLEGARMPLDSLLDDIDASGGIPPVDRWAPEHAGEMDLLIAADGRWIHEGGVIARPRLVRLLSTILRREGDGSHWLVTPVEKQRVQVEDLAFIAVDAERDDQATGMSSPTWATKCGSMPPIA